VPSTSGQHSRVAFTFVLCIDNEKEGIALKRLRILIVDDHPIYLEGLRAILASDIETELIGEANNAKDAILLATELQPDVVLMDIKLPLDAEGIEASYQIKQTSPQSKVLFLTGEADNPLFLPAALRSGGYGFMMKGADREEILRAIRAVSSGQMIFSGPSTTQQVAESVSVSLAQLSSHVFPMLSDREHEILNLVAKGRGNQDIANELSISAKTVGNYVWTITDKLQAQNRSHLIDLAREAGLG
jgi:DNA-binding NarL/FixJ family response regulator